MKALIMAAGLGQRFRKEGFEIPKPLIRYKDLPIIEHSLNQIPGIPRKDIIVVGIPEVCYYMKGAHPEIRTVQVEHTQNGPGMSALLAGGLIAEDESVVLIDCDIIISANAVQQFILDVAGNNYIGGALMYTTVEGDSSAYCSLLIKNKPVRETMSLRTEVYGLEEKTGSTPYIAVGVYAFKKWRSFRHHVFSMACNDNAKEVYLSGVMAQMMRVDGQEVRATSIPLSMWTCLGTPKELAANLESEG
jgi:dTDP-glucose pyrophosphorylase